MFSAISLLVLACAITINAQRPAPQGCSEAKIGNVPTPHAVKLEPINLQPYKRDWDVVIPHIEECVFGVAGVYALICDYDEAPEGYFTDFNHLKVHRKGYRLSYGTVTVTVYCVV